MTISQNCEAPLRWRERRQARLPHAPPTPQIVRTCILVAGPVNQGSRVRAPLSTAHRHFAYDIGHNSAPSSSEMGMESNMKSLFMRMMSEPSAEARNSPYPVVSTVCALQQPQADQPGPCSRTSMTLSPPFATSLKWVSPCITAPSINNTSTKFQIL